jgi:hypothetical protein
LFALGVSVGCRSLGTSSKTSTRALAHMPWKFHIKARPLRARAKGRMTPLLGCPAPLGREPASDIVGATACNTQHGLGGRRRVSEQAISNVTGVAVFKKNCFGASHRWSSICRPTENSAAMSSPRRALLNERAGGVLHASGLRRGFCC